ncbi:lanC-like protein 3 homolog [Diorhabda carinulata]|uniref:lanC-like protein 3 homolog n=1 Tax=Diorhabda carinulata TaxID=1163345 RepID=UPI0025A2DCFD|nr:lanC-like protein 3 homolog [Diorhabda carinulata]
MKEIKSFSCRIRRIFGTMSRSRSRFFPNPKHDYKGPGQITIPVPEITQRIDETLVKIENGVKPTEKNASEGIYLGTAGIAYMFYHLSNIPSLSSKKSLFLNQAIMYLKPALVVAGCNKTEDVASFMLGSAGIYAVAAAVYKSIGELRQSNHFIQLYYDSAKIVKKENFLSHGSDELFVGRTGYILGALWISAETNTPLRKKEIYEICDVIVKSGKEYSERCNCHCPLMYSYYQVEYLGAAHGLCSILQVLLTVPGYMDSHPNEARDIKNSIDFLLSVQDQEGNFPSATDEIGYTSELVHWCHGAPGMIFLMAKAYLVFKESKYLDACVIMGGLIWEKGLLKKGPGICHGVAGNGYVFLILYRLTQEPKYLHRALEFYNFMWSGDFQSGSRTPDYPYSLYEGLAGTTCFMADLTCPLQAKFPFYDIFCVYK